MPHAPCPIPHTPPYPSPPPPLLLSILITRGSPIDAPQYRHTALYLETLSSSPPHPNAILLEITGGTGFFSPRATSNTQPLLHADFLQKIPGARIEGVRSAHLVAGILGTEMRDGEGDWNCESWVGDVLGAGVRRGWVAESERGGGWVGWGGFWWRCWIRRESGEGRGGGGEGEIVCIVDMPRSRGYAGFAEQAG
ncbi:hypothetical protein MMC30_002902 [Trapelia coarctata]|nr:hypothetical protein [Trapelia coarctata]